MLRPDVQLWRPPPVRQLQDLRDQGPLQVSPNARSGLGSGRSRYQQGQLQILGRDAALLSHHRRPPSLTRLTEDAEDQGPRTEDRGPRTEDRGPRTGDRGPRTGDRGPRTGDRGPRTEDRGPRTGDRGPRTEDRGRLITPLKTMPTSEDDDVDL